MVAHRSQEPTLHKHNNHSLDSPKAAIHSTRDLSHPVLSDLPESLADRLRPKHRVSMLGVFFERLPIQAHELSCLGRSAEMQKPT